MRSELLRALVERQFPFPIAYWFRRSLEERDSRDAACSLLLFTLEHFGLVLIADYLAQGDRDPEMDHELQRIFDSPVAAGVWRDWTFRILHFYKERARHPVLSGLEALLDRHAQTELAHLIEWRNRWVHASTPFNLGTFRRNISNLLERIQPIHKSTLFCPHSSKMSGPIHLLRVSLIKGDNPNFSEVDLRSAVPLESGQVYLYDKDSRSILPLHPFITLEACSECDEKHLFHFARPGGHMLSYASVPGGHVKSSEEGYLSLEQLFRHVKERRVYCRHFAVPGDFTGLARTLDPGDHIGSYRVEALIKIGGMAQVYRVTDTRTGKMHALKLLPVELSRDPLLLMRFEEEVKNLQRLKHPNVAVLHDFGEEFGDHYLVLDLATGQRAGQQFCQDLSEIGKPLPEKAILEIGKQICDGLHYVHSQGVIHRDLKPGNLLLSGDKVILTDFGISRGRGENRITLTGMPVGTPEYMSPEQIQEEDVDKRTDIYALGCVLYELATARPPYQADTPLTTALYHLQASPPRIEMLNPRLSRGLVNIICKCLKKNREHRYSTARQLFEDLSRAGEDPAGLQVIEGAKVPQDIAQEVRARERRTYRRRLGVAVALMVCLSFLALWGRAIFKDWQIKTTVAAAEKMWESGADSWQEACEILRNAYLADPHHPAVTAFLMRAGSRGALTAHTIPGDGLKIEVEPNPEEAAKLGLTDLEPRVLSSGQSFRSCERIFLGRGHYEVTIKFKDGHSARLPVFIGYEGLSRESSGRWNKKRLRPEEPAVKSVNEFTFAEELQLENVVCPGPPSEAMCAVLPGPFWLAVYRDDDFRPQSRTTKGGETTPYEGATSSELSSVYLAQGFLIGRKEVTVPDFHRWFQRFHEECFQFFEDEQYSIARSQMPRKEPLERSLESYKANNKKIIENGAGMDLSSIQSFGDLYTAIGKAIHKRWTEEKENLKSYLEDGLKDPEPLPVARVSLPVALAYALTHSPVMAGELKPWLKSRTQETEDLLKKLEALVSELRKESSGLVGPTDIPEDIRFWRWGERFRDWVGPGQEGEISQGWELARKAFESRLKSEGKKKSLTAEKMSVESVLEWLQEHVDREKKALEENRKLLEAVDSTPSDAEVQSLPWRVRLEYGWDAGWSLPPRAQWEKAFRGPDTRLYPWGNVEKRFALADGWPSKRQG